MSKKEEIAAKEAPLEDAVAQGSAPEEVVAQEPPKTVKMIRDEPAFNGGPTEADVNVLEVENWKATGWVVQG